MKLKNTDLLLRRARWHARHDHVVQGTFAEATMNGEVEFKGCAIGCLATPHTKRGLRSWLQKVGIDRDGEVDEYSSDMVNRLRKEFGICEALALRAEDIFEDLDTHAEAIDFIPAFAAALNEGADITPRKLDRLRLPDDPGERQDKFLNWLKEQH